MADKNEQLNATEQDRDNKSTQGSVDNAGSAYTNSAVTGILESEQGVKTISIGRLVDFDYYRSITEQGGEAHESSLGDRPSAGQIIIEFGYLPPYSAVNLGSLNENGIWMGTLEEAAALELQLPSDFTGFVVGSVPLTHEGDVSRGVFHMEVGNPSTGTLAASAGQEAAADGAATVSMAEALGLVGEQLTDLENAESVSIRLQGLPGETSSSDGEQYADGSWVFSGTGAQVAGMSLTFGAGSQFGAFTFQITKAYAHGYEAFIPLEAFDPVEGDVVVGVTAAMDLSGSKPTIALQETDAGNAPLQVRLSDYLGMRVEDDDGSESLITVEVRLSGLPDGARFSTDGGTSFSSAAISGGSLSYKGPAEGFGKLVLEIPADYASAGAIKGLFSAYSDEYGRATQGFDIRVQPEADIELSAENVTAAEAASGGTTVQLAISANITDADGSEGHGDTPNTVTILFDRLPDGTSANTGTLDMGALKWTGSINEAKALALTFPENYSTTAKQVTFGDNLIINGSFEDTYVEATGWGSFMGGDGVPGWAGERVEIQNTHWGHAASNGQQWMELDAERGVDSVHQDVKTEAGTQYQLSFDVSTRFYNTSTFDVSWNGEVISTVVPEGRQWETITLTVEGTGGMDRLTFTELASQNSAFGAFIDNVKLFEAVVIEDAPIVMRTTVMTPEGAERTISTLEVTPTQDIKIEAKDAAYTEGDAPLTVMVGDLVSVKVTDADGSEVLESISVTLNGLPEDTQVSAGTLAPDGSFSWTGTQVEFADLSLTLPKDFSTANPAVTLSGTASAISNEGASSVTPFSLTVAAEGDISVGLTDAVETSGGSPVIALSETDSHPDALLVHLGDYFTAQATDTDGSESLATIAFEIFDLPEGTLLSKDGGETFSSANMLGNSLSYHGAASTLANLVLALPADYSSTNPLSDIQGVFTATTDEGGEESISFGVTVAHEADIELTSDDVSGTEDAYGSGTAVKLAISAAITDRDASEGTADTPDTVTITFDRLPEGTTANGGALDVAGLTWTGSVNEANALTLTFPEHFASTHHWEATGENLIVNGSFEADSLDGQVWKAFSAEQNLTGWSGGDMELQKTSWIGTASDGEQWLELDAERGLDSISQEVQTEEGQVYLLSFDVSAKFLWTSTFDVSWNDTVISTVVPEGRDWVTITLQVEGSGGLDRLTFSELDTQNDALGALLDNVRLTKAELVEDGPIRYTTTVTTPEGQMTADATLTVEATQDISVVTEDVRLSESDEAIRFTLSDHARVAVLDSDLSENITRVDVELHGLPAGSVPSAGEISAEGVFTFSGSLHDYLALEFTLPKDFSTENPATQITGSIWAQSNEGSSAIQPISIFVSAEADLAFDYTQAMDTSGEDAQVMLAETDSGGDAVLVTLADYFSAAATDADGSEALTTLTLNLTGLPNGTQFSADGGATFMEGAVSDGAVNYTGPAATLAGLVLALPPISPQSDELSVFGDLTMRTDEGGEKTLAFKIGNDRIMEDATGTEDGDGQGVTIDVGFSASAVHLGQLGADWNAEDAVTITFDRLPDGTTANGGTLDLGALTWTGTVNEANALALTFPEDYSTTNRGDISGENLIFNGSFETVDLGGKVWGSFVDGVGVAGWSGGRIEIQNTGVGINATDGNQFMELDAEREVDTVYQDIQTEAGGTYQLTFDVATRVWESSAFDVTWNGETIASVNPQWGKGWSTISLQVEGTGGLDRLAFTEHAALNNAFGALIDNVELYRTGLVESKPIALSTVIEGAEGQLAFETSLSIEPTVDINIETRDFHLTETDSAITVNLADNIAVIATDADGSELIESITLVMEGLPSGAAVNIGEIDGSGTFRFTGSPSAFDTIVLTLPADYATQSDKGPLVGEVTATSNEGISTATPFKLRIDVEGDVSLGYAQAMETSGEVATIALTETDRTGSGLEIKLDDYFDGAATDLDGSESIETITLEITGLPQSTQISTNGGQSFEAAPLTDGKLTYLGNHASLSEVIVKLPADYSTTNPGSVIDGQLTITTDENGIASLPFAVTVAHEVDIDLSARNVTAYEDASGEGVLVDLKISANITDRDGSEGTNTTPDTVTITFNGLPEGTTADRGTLDIDTGIWTGSTKQASDLRLRFPKDHSTTSAPEGQPETPVTYEVTVMTSEGTKTASGRVTIRAREDISLTAQDETVSEDTFSAIPLNLSVSVSDSDGSEVLNEPVSIQFSGLPQGATFNGGSYDAQTGLWQGTEAELEALVLSGVPQHFSGKVTGTLSANTNEGSDTTAFTVRVLPVAEPEIALSVVAHSSSGDTQIVKEGAPFTVHIEAKTADTDGSESLTTIVLQNVPDGWPTLSGANAVDLSTFTTGADDIQSASYNGATGALTITLKAGVTNWVGDLILTPDSGQSLDIASLTGGELTATVTAVDVASGLPSSTATASDAVDVDVDAVAGDPTLTAQDEVHSEALEGAGSSKLRITSLSLSDTDGSERYGPLILTIATGESGSDELSVANDVTLFSSQPAEHGTITRGLAEQGKAVYVVSQPEGVNNADYEAFVKNLGITYPEHHSGVFELTGVLEVFETVQAGDNEYDTSDNTVTITFETEITVNPVAQANLTVTLTPSDEGFDTTPHDDPSTPVSVSVGEDVPTVEIYEDSSISLGLEASTPDLDGSEELTSLVVNNLPNLWFAYDAEGTVDPSLFGAEASKISSAVYDAQTGQLTVTFTPETKSFEGSLLLTPIAHDDRDVDASDSLPGQDSSGFFGDITVDLNVTDARDMQNATEATTTVSVGVDIDVEAVNDLSTLPDAFVVSEATVDAAGGWVDVPLFPTNPDSEGSETIETLGIYGIPKGVVLFYRTEDGELTPAKLMGVEPKTGMTNWALENGQWESAVLRGIPQHFSGVLTANAETGEVERSVDGTTTITARVLTRELNDNETGQTDTGELVIRISPSIDGGNPNETHHLLEDVAYNPSIDGNLIDIRDGSPEELTGDVVLTLGEGLPNTVGQEARFFLGDPEAGGTEIFADGNGQLTVDSAVVGTLHILSPRDSNEDYTLGIQYQVREATDPDGPVKTETGTLTMKVSGVADTPTVIVPDAAYTGTDAQAFTLDTVVNGEDGAAVRLGGLMTEMMPDGINYDGSENLYFIISGDALSTMATRTGSIAAAPSVSFANGLDTGAGAVIVSAADIGNLKFIPVNVSETTDYQFTLSAIVVENDERIPTGTNVADAAALQGVAIAQADFYVRVEDKTPQGGGGSPPEITLPEPPEVTISPLVGVEDQEASFTITLNNYDGEFAKIPQQGSIEITGVPTGSVLRAEPADALSYNPVTGSYFLNHAVADAQTTYFITFPKHMSSADTPVDGLDQLTVTSMSMDVRYGLAEVVEQVTTVYVDPVADAPRVRVTSPGGGEDTAIPVFINVGLVDPGETLADTMLLSLSASQGVLADASGEVLAPISQAGGTLTYEISSSVTSLKLIPTQHLHGDIPIKVTVSSTEPNGSSASTTSTVTVPVEAIADVGQISFDPGLEQGSDSGEELPVVTALEDMTALLESVIETATPDTDGSEIYTITLSGLPDFMSVNVGADNGLDSEGLRSFTMSPAEYSRLEIGLKDANARLDGVVLPEQVRLTLEVNTLELSNGDTNAGTADFLFKVTPDADAPTLAVEDAAGLEDTAVALNILAEVTDPAEVISHYTISGVPDGAQILVDGAAVATGPDTAEIAADDIGAVSFLPAKDSAAPVTLTVVAVSSEPTVADQSADNATESSEAQTLAITITPQADVSVHVEAQDTAQTGEVLPVTLNLSATITDMVGPSTETLEEVSLTFANLPKGTTFNAGTLSPDGRSVTIARSAYGSEAAFVATLAGLVAMLPADFDGVLSGTATAKTTEGTGDGTAFSVNVNAQPEATAPLTLNKEGAAQFTLTEAELLTNIADADSTQLSVLEVGTEDAQAQVTTGATPGTWLVTVAGGYEGSLTLSYTVSDGESQPATLQTTALVSVDNENELTLTATGETVELASGETAQLMGDVSGTTGTHDVAVGSDANEAVVFTDARSYADVEGFFMMGGHDIVDLTLSYKGYTVDLGTGNDFAIGSEGADLLMGGSGNDRLDGGLGADTLFGGEGADTFVISSLSAADMIADYSGAEGDVVDLTGLFEVATDVQDYVNYNSLTGELKVDADGAENGQNFQLAATLDAIPTNLTVQVDDGTDSGTVTI
ncbi:DUF642 domain-containing protein [Pseudovibrio sp. SPO723]|uniref:DUF642 domain-containing protein n=1 Tax=Nesiotobacter zosterae TaxID=392721 RepID=UPI0029C3FB14|nr:DUF642 domain-containing protein [Pseudovibrio sp. SPO723]MDX5595684.1 DUF642 domain-containing protein [Pseudovibrio sp. SPO723]